MALRITGTFKSPAATIAGPDYSHEYTVNVYDNDFVGTATEAIILSVNLSWSSDKESDRHASIIGSLASVDISVPSSDSNLTSFVEDFAYGEDARFLLEITKDTSPTSVWKGVLKADQSGEEDIDPFTFRLSGVCGLAILKDKPYHDGSAIYTGIASFIDHICTALLKMPHATTLWGGSDPFIRTSVDWWAASMASGDADDSLNLAGVDHSAFYDYKTTEGDLDKDVLSCYDVLSHIAKAFACRIYQSEGVYRIEQIPYRSTGSYKIRDYDQGGNFLANDTISGSNVINQTSAGAKINLITYDFLPILKKAEVLYDVKIRRNYLGSKNLTEGDATIGFNQQISSNGATSTLRLKGTVTFGIQNLSYSGGANDILFYVPNISLKLGSNYLKRDYSITNFTATTENPEWSTDVLSRIYLPHLLGQVVPVGLSMNGIFSFEILSPPIPADSDLNSLTFSKGTIYKWDGSAVNVSQFQVFWSASGLYLEVYEDGTPTVNEDQVLYVATNPLEANEIYKVSTRIGTEVLPNSAGRVWRWTGSAWVTAPLWGQGAETRDDALGDILARNILNGQSGSRRRMNGSIFGSLRLHRLMQTTDGKKWMFSRVDWNIADNMMKGSWVELNYGSDGVSSTPKKIKVVPNGPTVPPLVDPVNPTGLSGTSSGFNINPSPAVLAPVSYNQLDVEIAKGASVTSIPLKIASEANDFLIGDGVTIMHPYTGQYQTFTISAAPSAGDTSLSVSSAASIADFPEDSYLIVKQKAYSFRPKIWKSYKGTVSSNRVIVPGGEFTIPDNPDEVMVIVRRQFYHASTGLETRDYEINTVDNSVDFQSSLGLNGQIAFIKVFVLE